MAGTMTAEQRVMAKLDSIEQKQGVLEGFLDVLKEPAQQQGLSPEALLAKMASRNQHGFGYMPGFGGGGRVFPGATRNGALYSKGLGDVRGDDGAHLGNFGEYLRHLYTFADKGISAGESAKYLDRLGVQRIGGEGKDGEITKAALAEASGITGGYTVPVMFSNQLMTLAVEDTIVAPRAAKQPLTSRTLQIPSLDITTVQSAGTSPFLGGINAVWTSEAATRTETEPAFRQTTLTAWELSFYSLASNNLLADNAVGLDSLLTQLFSAAIGWYTDYAFLRGDGVGKPLGIMNSPATISVTRNAAAHFNFVDVANMLSQLYWLLRKGGSVAWVIHPSVIADLYRMNDMSASQTGVGFGRVLFIPIDRGVQAEVPGGAQEIGSLAGFPVLVSEKLPALGTTGCVMLADFSKYLLGTRQELQIDVSPHVRFLNNQMAWRVVWRGDGQPWLNSYVTLQDGSYKVSPFLILTQ
jgi:HK97 family phage major capsid protein